MEMEGGGLVPKLILDIDNNSVSLCRSHGWRRPLAIDTNGRSLEDAIWVGTNPGDVEIIGDGSCFSDVYEG